GAPARATLSPAARSSLPGGSRWLEPQRLCLAPGRPSLRRILVGLEVVRPRCAVGAPPRPRLRSTAPRHVCRNEAKQLRQQRIPTLTGVRNTDKANACCGSRRSRITPRSCAAGG